MVSVIIVSYNTKDHLRSCLRSLPGGVEVIVVDNASTDGSPEMVAAEFSGAILISNPTNRGFGAANNQGLDVMTGQLALLLNSDARPEPGAIAELAKVFDDAGVAFAGGRLQFPNGRLQESACNELTLWAVFCEQSLLEKLLPNCKLFSPYWISSRLLATGSDPHPVAQVMGSCLMMRPVERFDERFFLYTEDTEICKRLAQHGQGLYVPSARFIHDLGVSSAGTRWQAVARYNRGKELYFAIHRSGFAAVTCWIMNRLGALLRLLIWLVMSLATLFAVARFRKGIWLFARVLFSPISGPALPADTRPKPTSDRLPS